MGLSYIIKSDSYRYLGHIFVRSAEKERLRFVVVPNTRKLLAGRSSDVTFPKPEGATATSATVSESKDKSVRALVIRLRVLSIFLE